MLASSSLSLPPIALIALSFSWVGAALRAEPPPALGSVLYRNICTQCHGVQGEGNVLMKAPSIAGLPAWYVRGQLHNFKEGRRGTDPHDPTALLMAATAKILLDEHIEAVAATVETLKPVPPVVEKAATAAATAQGRLLFEERCMECHRYNGTGEIVFGSARLLGLQEWYLAGQLRKFKDGQRGAALKDENGAKMVAAAQHIESDKELLAVVAYIMTLNSRIPETRIPEFPKSEAVQGCKMEVAPAK